MITPVNAVGRYGIVNDLKPHEMPLEAWSDGLNVRFIDGFVEKCQGEQSVATPSVPPYWAQGVRNGANYFWIYAGLAKVYGTSLATQAEITRVSGIYNATADLNWTGGVMGGIPYLNNGVDVPQVWTPIGLSQKLVDLPNWPAATTCQALRHFKTFMLALDVTEAGTRYSSVLRWSHPADPGAVPSSWDYADTGLDAGRVEMAETGGALIDSLPLRDNNILYKEDSIYFMQYLSNNRDIFRINRIFEEVGIIAKRNMAMAAQGYHAVFTGDDFVKHDGQQMTSLITGKMRRWLTNRLDTTNYVRSFVATYYGKKEVWLCFVPVDKSFATLVLIWSWETGAIGIREIPNLAHAAPGVINLAEVTTWGTDAEAWDSDTGAWDKRTYKPYLKDLMLIGPSIDMLKADQTNQFSGVNMTSWIERQGIGVPFKTGQPPDFSTRKFWRAVYPRIEGTVGGQINVYVGYQDKIGVAPVYKAAKTYTIGTTLKIDALVSGKLFALKFESTSDIEWRLHGYDLDVEFLGQKS